MKLLSQGDVKVFINGRRWIYNPRCFRAAPGEEPPKECAFVAL